jgi:PAS domain S-box-containing protein
MTYPNGFRSIRTKFLVVGLAAVLLSGSVSLFLAFAEHREFQKQLEANAVSVATQTAFVMGPLIAFDSRNEMKKALDLLRANPDFAYARVSDENDSPLALLGSVPLEPCRGITGPQVVDKARAVHVTTPIVDAGKTWGCLQIGLSKERTEREVTKIWMIALVAGAVTILITLLGGFYLSHTIAHPVRRLSEAASRVAQGEWDAPIEWHTRDEIGLLARSLCGMLEELRQTTVSKSYVDDIVQSMGDSLLVIDTRRRIRTANRATYSLLGHEEGTLIDQPIERIMTRVERFDASLAAGQASSRGVEAEYLTFDGQRIPVLISAAMMRAGEGMICLAQDIRERQRAQRELLMAKEQAEAANRAKSEFLSRMSHELRTPMNAILGFAQVLEMDSLSPHQRTSVDQILKGGGHLLTLINEVLDITRIEAGKLALSPEPILIRSALDEVLDLVAPLAAHSGVTIVREMSESWGRYLQADCQRLKQVLLNILSNAIKYNREAGRVTVSCAVHSADRLRIEVSDTGRGIPPQKMDLLFRPFERLGVEEAGIEGTGVGLSLCKKLVDAMDGSIGAVSEFGQGSIFWVEFPCVEGPTQRYERLHDEKLAADADTWQKSITVLYVEDNLSNSELMERILATRPGIKLVSAMQGRVALDLAREHVPDVILLDMHLPDLQGDAVLRQLRADPQTKHIPVAMVSADATQGQIQRLLAAGAQNYFTKPLDIKKLLAFLDATVQQATATPATSSPADA